MGWSLGWGGVGRGEVLAVIRLRNIHFRGLNIPARMEMEMGMGMCTVLVMQKARGDTHPKAPARVEGVLPLMAVQSLMAVTTAPTPTHIQPVQVQVTPPRDILILNHIAMGCLCLRG